MSELKNCPFCGEKAELIDNRLEWYVECTDCGVVVIGKRAPEPESDADLNAIDWNVVKQSAINAWNTRHIPEGYALVPAIGSYCFASRYSDEDLNDPWSVGFLSEVKMHNNGIFYKITGDGCLNRFFINCRPITKEEGDAILLKAAGDQDEN